MNEYIENILYKRIHKLNEDIIDLEIEKLRRRKETEHKEWLKNNNLTLDFITKGTPVIYLDKEKE